MLTLTKHIGHKGPENIVIARDSVLAGFSQYPLRTSDRLRGDGKIVPIQVLVLPVNKLGAIWEQLPHLVSRVVPRAAGVVRKRFARWR